MMNSAIYEGQGHGSKREHLKFHGILLESISTELIPHGDMMGADVWVFYGKYSHFQGILPGLSKREMDVAHGFKFQAHARLYRFSHGILRLILGHILDVGPESLEISADANGKPFVSRPGNPSLYFNLSHSGEAAVLAVSRKNEIGVDIEQVRFISDMVDLVTHFFHPRDIQFFDQLSPKEKKEGFFRLWTQKEAIVKALGLGISFPLDGFHIPGMDGGDYELSGGGWVNVFSPWPDYMGAVAVRDLSCALGSAPIRPDMSFPRASGLNHIVRSHTPVRGVG